MDSERQPDTERVAAAAVSDADPTQPGDLIGYAEAAALLSLPVNTLYCWVHERRIPHIRLGPRLVRFSCTRLKEWLNDHCVESIPRR